MTRAFASFYPVLPAGLPSRPNRTIRPNDVQTRPSVLSIGPPASQAHARVESSCSAQTGGGVFVHVQQQTIVGVQLLLSREANKTRDQTLLNQQQGRGS